MATFDQVTVTSDPAGTIVGFQTDPASPALIKIGGQLFGTDIGVFVGNFGDSGPNTTNAGVRAVSGRAESARPFRHGAVM